MDVAEQLTEQGAPSELDVTHPGRTGQLLHILAGVTHVGRPSRQRWASSLG